MTLYEDLKWRGLIKDISSPDLEDKLNNEKLTFYIGTDPTADSMHIGHYSSFLIAKRLAKYGHKPILLIGGGTGLIGDPKPSKERQMITRDEVLKNVEGLTNQAKKIFGFEVVNNYDWIKDIDTISFLRDYGKYINVNYMLSKDIINRRLESGITFCEFAYTIIQGLDFVHLNEAKGVTLQVAGSDQWANMIAGVELARKMDFANEKEDRGLQTLTCPLLVKADGEKMGKTASGTLWVSREKTTVYDFYQMFMNSFDEDVERLLSFFSDYEIEDIKRMCKEDIRSAKKLMAFEVTKLVHGEEEALKVKKASEDIFYGKGTSVEMPNYTIDFSEIKPGIDLADLMVKIQMAKSKSEVRRLLEQGGIYLNEKRVDDNPKIVTASDFVDDEMVLRRGKKNYMKVLVKR